MNTGEWIQERDYFERMKNEIYEEVKLITKDKFEIKIKRLLKSVIIVTFRKLFCSEIIQFAEVDSIENYLIKYTGYQKGSVMRNSAGVYAVFRCNFEQKESYYVD